MLVKKLIRLIMVHSEVLFEISKRKLVTILKGRVVWGVLLYGVVREVNILIL